jgi:hypothetical protein
MNEHFESKEDEKSKMSRTSQPNRDHQTTGEGTEEDDDGAKVEKPTIENHEEPIAPEQSAEAQEIERRLKELGKEMTETKLCIIAALLLRKEASLFFKVVNLLKLIDIIFVFSLTVTPSLILAVTNLVVNLLLYYKNCNAIYIPSRHVFVGVVIMFSSLVVLAGELKADYVRFNSSEFMPLFLPFLGLWIIQTIIWTAQMIVLLHTSMKELKKEEPETKKPELETSSIQNSNLMVSHNMSKIDQESDQPVQTASLPISQSTDKVSTGDEPISSDRGGTKKLKRRPKEPKA